MFQSMTEDRAVMFQSMTEDRAVMFRSVSEWAGRARALFKVMEVWSVVLKVAVCCTSRTIFKLVTVWSVVLKMTTRCHCKSAV